MSWLKKIVKFVEDESELHVIEKEIVILSMSFKMCYEALQISVSFSVVSNATLNVHCQTVMHIEKRSAEQEGRSEESRPSSHSHLCSREAQSRAHCAQSPPVVFP